MWTSSDPSCRARREENDRLLQLLPRRLIELESLYAPHRWDGYQFMSPLECTRQFAADYRDEFRRKFYSACHFEPQAATEEFETLWTMRLEADSCLMSYPMYLAVAFSIVRLTDADLLRRPHMRFSKFQHLKTWNKRVLKAYTEMGRREHRRIASMSHFQRKSFCGLPAQHKFRETAKTIAKRLGPKRGTETYMLQHPVLSAADLVSGLSGRDRVDAIAGMQTADRSIINVSQNVAPGNLLQTCFAWPRRTSWVERCKACPQEVACSGEHFLPPEG